MPFVPDKESTKKGRFVPDDNQKQQRFDALQKQIDPIAGKTIRSFFNPMQSFSDLGQKISGQDPQSGNMDAELGRQSRGFVESATGGLPRGGIEKATGLDIGRGGGFGQFVGTVVGPGGIGTKIAKKIAGKGIIRAGIGGSVGGGAAGFLTAPIGDDPFDIGSRAVTGTLGALIGGPLGSIGALGSKISKARSASKALKANEQQQRAIKSERIIRNVKFNKKKSSLNNLFIKKEKIDPEVRKEIRKEIQQLNDDMANIADKKIVEVRGKMADSVRSAKSKWGDVADDLINNSEIESVKYDEFAKDVFQKTIEELEYRDIKINRSTISTVNSIIDKYKPQDKVSKLLDSQGLPISQKTASKNIPIKELVKLRREVQKGISSKFKKGAFEEDDMAALIFNRRLADKLEDVVPGLKEHNQLYRGVMSKANFIYKNFRPQAFDQEETKAGIRLLKQMGLGKISPDDMRMIEQIENGQGLFPGVGKFTQGIKSQGEKIRNLSGKLSQKQLTKNDQILTKKLDQVKRIKTKILNKQSALNAKDKLTINELDNEAALLRETIDANKIAGAIGRTAAYQAASFAVQVMLFKLFIKNNE